jgi:hypothetical protein
VSVADWTARFRAAPIGVLALAGVLVLLGAALLVAGAFNLLLRDGSGWIAWVCALLAGPLAVYFGVRLAGLARWSWLAVMILFSLLLASSLSRAFLTPAFLGRAAGEIVLEGFVLLYFGRVPVRAAFGR